MVARTKGRYLPFNSNRRNGEICISQESGVRSQESGVRIFDKSVDDQVVIFGVNLKNLTAVC
ncbi:hypothetical protein [Trichormus sp. NMC-1]|uniref:hypothetical protein n=1 Tax=Trichormus sp. NMC-1 TaxID=1853259 RepID=UPI00115FA98E|nr:hypothetical protein [Trichormus sp. NMC-1]